ncbi:SDR family NAD(P)-dependent oxidoreductase [Sphingomonas sp.]|uniref:SDR family NAD(P)-dependent oxidoreductase n=1 Tax=Sphingomonas sp. TaxID=28214 RepID=UPI002DD63A04|nr:SDR family NAD(P)-dependent oxidoreductase [Sphingomonas sp.]
MTDARTAIVTGAAQGLGLAIANGLAASGHHCILLDRSDSVHAVAQGLSSPLGTAEGHAVDVTDYPAVAALVASVIAEHGRIDVLVNNAGINPKNPSGGIFELLEIPLEGWRHVVDVNLNSVFHLCVQVLPHMQRRNWGRIINISSRTGRTYTGTAAAHYAATKAGVIGLTRQIAGEMGRHGITANCIAPGPITSPMSTADGGQGIARTASRGPLGRVGAPEEIGATAQFLASDGAAYITGAIIDLNGGTFMP